MSATSDNSDSIENKDTLSDADFKRELAAVIPHLRAFGRSLSGSRDVADDLVQETLLKAWAARERFAELSAGDDFGRAGAGGGDRVHVSAHRDRTGPR